MNKLINLLYWVVPYTIFYVIFFNIFKRIGAEKLRTCDAKVKIAIFVGSFIIYLVGMLIANYFNLSIGVYSIIRGSLLGIMISEIPFLAKSTKRVE